MLKTFLCGVQFTQRELCCYLDQLIYEGENNIRRCLQFICMLYVIVNNYKKYYIVLTVGTMDFFGDDFGFGDSPNPRANKNKKPQTNKQIVINDGLDDLLDQMLQKQKKKTAKQKAQQQQSVTSLTSLDKSPGKQVGPAASVTSISNFQQPAPAYHTAGEIKNDYDFGKPYEPMRNRQSSKSIAGGDDRGSEDNKSYKSGFTGFGGAGGFADLDIAKGTSNLDALGDMPNIVGSSRMMKPPLRKRNESKMGSQVAQQDINPPLSITQLDNVLRQPPRKQPSPPKQPRSQYLAPPLPPKYPSQSNPSMASGAAPVVQQKIVYIKQQQKQLKTILQSHQKQLKLLKQSHQKQIKILTQQLQKEINTNKENKIKVLKDIQEDRKKFREVTENMNKREIERIKDMYEWQIKRKTQMYELEIDRLKKLSQITLKTSTIATPAYPPTSTNTPLQLQLTQRKQKLQQNQLHLRNRERELEQRESEFNSYRKLQETKLSELRKQLYKLQNDLNRKKIQQRKSLEQQKIAMTSDVAKETFQIIKQKDRLTIQRKQLEVQRELFEKRKNQFQEFNENVVRELKRKMKEVESQKEYCQLKQIDLYKKIQTVEMMGNLKANAIKAEQKKKTNQQNTNKNQPNLQKTKKLNQQYENIKKVQKQQQQQVNEQQKDNTLQNGKRNQKSKQHHYRFSPPHFEQKQRQRQKEEYEQSIRRSSFIGGSRTNLKEYLLKINKGNLRRPVLG